MTNTITLPRSVVEQALEALKYEKDANNPLDWHHDKTMHALRAALNQPQVNSPEIPEGWRLVPVEPTEEMRDAGKDAHYEAETRTSDSDAWSLTGFAHRVVRASYIYRAMLAAAPQPPVVEQPQGEQEMVGEAGSMPGTDGFTMACFRASDVPAGTKLYTHPQPPRQPLTDEQWLKLWTGETGQRLKPGPERYRLLRRFRFAERAHGIGG